MYQKCIAIFIAMFIINGCGGGGGGDVDGGGDGNNAVPVDNNTNKSSNFSYETQRTVNVSLAINSGNTSSQKQILLYEKQKTVNDPDMPGELTLFDALLIEGVIDTNGTYETHLTLGNHINSIWIVIPALAYQERVDIINNDIILNITKGL